MEQNKIKRGFTLAEILITMGIIGVIAAILIPLITNTVEDLQYTSALKANYKLISDATSQMTNDNGGSLKGVFTSVSSVRAGYMNYLKSTKTCDDTAILDNCWNSDYAKRFDTGDLYTSGGTAWWSLGSAMGLLLNNGTAIYFHTYSNNCSTTSECARFFIDTNGLKGPNTVGKDIYYFFLYTDRVSPNAWDTASSYGGRGDNMGKWRLTH